MSTVRTRRKSRMERCPKFRRMAHASRLTPKATRRIAPVRSVTSQSPTSPDGKALLMDVDCGAEHERKNWDGPQPAIEKLVLRGDKAVRVTGKEDYVWEPFWLSENEFLCIMQKENENRPSIYRMWLDGKR